MKVWEMVNMIVEDPKKKNIVFLTFNGRILHADDNRTLEENFIINNSVI